MEKKEILTAAMMNTVKVLETIPLKRFVELEKAGLTKEELMERAGDCETFFSKYFEDVLDLLIIEELKYLGNEAQNDYMLLYARGHISALRKIKDWFLEQKSLSLSRFEEGEEAEEGN